MEFKVLAAYVPRYGSTQDVAETIAASLFICGLPVDVRAARRANA